MSKNSIDYLALDNKINKRAYKLSEVSDKIEKVAFDLVRFIDRDDAANLWKVEEGNDGQTYIVALYEPQDQKIALEQEQYKKASNWEVKLNKVGNLLEVWYKKEPLVKVSCSQLGIPSNELNKVERYLPSKLASNKKLVDSLLNVLGKSAKKEVLNKYPELI
jgi:hypothetical protein